MDSIGRCHDVSKWYLNFTHREKKKKRTQTATSKKHTHITPTAFLQDAWHEVHPCDTARKLHDYPICTEPQLERILWSHERSGTPTCWHSRLPKASHQLPWVLDPFSLPEWIGQNASSDFSDLVFCWSDLQQTHLSEKYKVRKSWGKPAICIRSMILVIFLQPYPCNCLNKTLNLHQSFRHTSWSPAPSELVLAKVPFGAMQKPDVQPHVSTGQNLCGCESQGFLGHHVGNHDYLPLSCGFRSANRLGGVPQQTSYQSLLQHPYSVVWNIHKHWACFATTSPITIPTKSTSIGLCQPTIPVSTSIQREQTLPETTTTSCTLGEIEWFSRLKYGIRGPLRNQHPLWDRVDLPTS